VVTSVAPSLPLSTTAVAVVVFLATPFAAVAAAIVRIVAVARPAGACATLFLVVASVS
jgi:UPF0716 family protein affecting phage T7 exclusion